MKMTLKLSLSLFAAITVLLDVRVNGQAPAPLTPVNITIDEKGAGTYSIPGGSSGALFAFVFPDFGNGLAAELGFGYLFPGLPILPTFTLPIPVVGDVQLIEPSQGALSDVIRFNREPGESGVILFYSDNSDASDGDLADTGFPTNVLANYTSIPEIGPEENNGATYRPVVGEPGDLSGFGYEATYFIISDVPEVSSCAVGFMFGIAGLSVWRTRKAKAA